LLQRELRSDQVIYCSPVVDPYQPAEEQECVMPTLLDAFNANPPRVLTLQTRGPLIIRDLDRLAQLASRTTLRVSFSVTTNLDQVRRWFEPHCATFETRLDTMRALRRAGLHVFATLAPILPCDPEALAAALVDATDNDVIGDPLHIRTVKRHGATTNDAAVEIARKRGFNQWLEAGFQAEVVSRLTAVLRNAGRRFAVGPDAFSWLAALPNSQ
jgi:DNA repair photolyase